MKVLLPQICDFACVIRSYQYGAIFQSIEKNGQIFLLLKVIVIVAILFFADVKITLVP